MRLSVAGIRAALLAASAVAHHAQAQQWEMLRVSNEGAGCAYDIGRGRTVVFGGLAGTREFDGQQWNTVNTAHSPSARIAPAMTYDLARQRIVLVGGSDPTSLQLFLDTWEYDGVDWSQVVTPHNPSSLYPAITYDWFRRVAVLYDGRQQTWEYDGSDWTQRFPAVSPPLRHSHQIAFQLNGKTLLFGGFSSTSLNDTWEYDGATWRQLFPFVSPPPRARHGMTYDVARDCVVVHAGYDRTLTDTWEYRQGQWSQVNAGPTTYHWRRDLVFDWRAWQVRVIGFDATSFIQPGETWLYNGTAWVQSALPPHPTPRRGHVMVYDPVRGATVMFGGQWPWLNDTWEYVGGHWSLINATTSPSPRSFAAAAYDASSGSTLMFGGSYAQSLFDDTWRFDGQDWNQIAATVRPQPRCYHAMACDAARRRIVLFGGSPSVSYGSVYQDTWEFDGQRWIAITPPSSPPGRCNHAMAYDAMRSRIVIFGGNDYFTPLVDTWQYDGATWSVLPASGGPDVWRDLRGLRMTYDPQRGKLLLVGQRLWELDGSVWRAVTTPIGPSIPMDAGWVATPHDGVLLFGGLKHGSNYEDADQWSFHAAEVPSWTRHGEGCGGGASAPTLDVVLPVGSVLGTTVNVRIAAAGADMAMVAGGFDVWQWNGVPLPLPLDHMPAPGCKLWIAPTAGAELLAITGGLGILPIPIPADPTLAGLPLCLQAMTGNTAVGPSSLALTNAGVLRVY